MEIGSGELSNKPLKEQLVSDLVLENQLKKLGAVLPHGIHFRGFPGDTNDLEDRPAYNIVGTPLYAYNNAAENTTVMRLHEMTHGFLQMHLITQQPIPLIDYNGITKDDMLALGATFVRGDENNYRFNLRERIKDRLWSQQLAMYQRDPETSLRNFSEIISYLREKHHLRHRADQIHGSTYPPINFETIAAGTLQHITAELITHIRGPFGQSKGLNLEEALATYFAHHANQERDYENWTFNQGENAKRYTVALAKKYPEPEKVTSIIKQFGLKGFMEQNHDILDY